MTDQFQELRVRQLDEALSPFRSLGLRPPPRQGWARAIRQALGMSQRQLAADRLNRVSTSMELEVQGVSEQERQRQNEEIAGSLLRDRPKNFWDD